MIRRAFPLSVAAALATLSGLPADALEASGSIGASARREDTLSPSEYSTQHLTLDAALNAAGYLLDPGEIDWRGSARYGRNRASYSPVQSDENILTFDARASLFDVRQSKFSLVLNASRSQSDASQSQGDLELTGTTLTNSLTASMRASGGGSRPSLQLTGSWGESVNSGLGRPDFSRTTKSIDARSSHGSDAFGYNASYNASVEEGSLVQLNYLSQLMTFNARAPLTDKTHASVQAQHYIRTPRSTDVTNPTYEDTRADAWARMEHGSGIASCQYAFGHFLAESLGVPGIEFFRNGFRLGDDRKLSRDWWLSPGVSVDYSQDRLGTAETSSAGQTASSMLRWRPATHDKSILVETSARVALLEPTGGGVHVGWGAGALGRFGRRLQRATYGGSYRVDYDTDVSAVQGWSLRQSITGDANFDLGPSTSLLATLLLDTSRAHSPLLGDAASRTGQLTSTLRWRTRTVGLSAAISDGATGTLDSPIRGDALFVPTSFQTHTRMASAFASTAFRHRWATSATLRYASISAPNLDAQREFVAAAQIAYRVGQIQLGIEDIYRMAGTTALDQRRNDFMITLSRNFRLLGGGERM